MEGEEFFHDVSFSFVDFVSILGSFPTFCCI